MSASDAALLVLRVGIGVIFAAHGAQKLFGWWSGPGFAGWHGAMARMGYRPTAVFAAVSSLAEFVGGLALAAGLLTPIAAMALVGQSIVIIGTAHWRSGFFNRNNGYEFPLALLTGVVAVLLAGPGSLSLDAEIGVAPAPEMRFALLVVAIAGGLATLALPRLADDQPTARA